MFSFFHAAILSIRLKTVIRCIDRGDVERALYVLDKTTTDFGKCAQGNVPLTVVEEVMTSLDVAYLLGNLGYIDEMKKELTKTRRIIQRVVACREMMTRRMMSFKRDIGSMCAIPYDVLEVVVAHVNEGVRY